MIEKRKYKRYPIICKVESTNAEIIITDMSIEGLKIITAHKFKDRSDLSFTLVLPSFTVIKIICDIIWEKQTSDKEYRYGIQITNLSKNDKKSYYAYINDLESSSDNLINNL